MKSMYSYGFAALAAVLVLSNCAKKNDTAQTMQLNGVAYRLVGDAVKHENSKGASITAESAHLQFQKAAPATASNVGYNLSFTLPVGGSLTLVSHSKDQLSEGISLRFSRSGSILLLDASSPGKPFQPVAHFNEQRVNAIGAIDLAVDVHNKNESHIMVWQQSTHPRNEGNALVSLEDTLKQGTGVVFGLVLNHATVTRAEMTAASHEHGH